MVKKLIEIHHLTQEEFLLDERCSPHVGAVSTASSKLERRRGACKRRAAPVGSGNRMPELDGKQIKDDDDIH